MSLIAGYQSSVMNTFMVSFPVRIGVREQPLTELADYHIHIHIHGYPRIIITHFVSHPIPRWTPIARSNCDCIVS